MTGELTADISLDRGDFRLKVEASLALSGITAVFGANGSGKTSLLRVIAGLEPSAQGTLRFRDREWQGQRGYLPAEARATGYVFQDGRLFPHLTVKGNLEYPLKQGKRSGPIQLIDTVKTFELDTLLTRYPAALSGGERQRVAIARALLTNPELLLMDEPLSSLDNTRKRELLPRIKRLPIDYGIPIVYVTHDIDELVYLADSVVLLANGRNVAHGSAREILERNDFEQLAELSDPGNVLEARIENHTDGSTLVSIRGGELRIRRIAGDIGDSVRLRIHPRDVVLASEKISGISIRNCLATTVLKLEDHSDDQISVSLIVGDQMLKAHVTADAATELGLKEGGNIYALIKAVALDVFARR
jgi:molybdate transport system ATP-binding protein